MSLTDGRIKTKNMRRHRMKRFKNMKRLVAMLLAVSGMTVTLTGCILDKVEVSRNVTQQQTTQQSTLPSTTELAVKIHDMKEYADLQPACRNGTLEERISKEVFDGAEIAYSAYGGRLLGNGKIETDTSTNNDGFIVWVNQRIENLYVYGVIVGMTEAEADAAFRANGLQYMENAYSDKYKQYTIDAAHYIKIDVSNQIVTRITYYTIWKTYNYIY